MNNKMNEGTSFDFITLTEVEQGKGFATSYFPK